jgi:putative SOS response-associated peptidase YedK
VRDVVRHRESLGALSGAGFRAYVAAYLVGSLEGDNADDLTEYALFSLRPTTEAKADADEVHERIAALDAAQRAAIRAWLEYQQEHHALARTLLGRWS